MAGIFLSFESKHQRTDDTSTLQIVQRPNLELDLQQCELSSLSICSQKDPLSQQTLNYKSNDLQNSFLSVQEY